MKFSFSTSKKKSHSLAWAAQVISFFGVAGLCSAALGTAYFSLRDSKFLALSTFEISTEEPALAIEINNTLKGLLGKPLYQVSLANVRSIIQKDPRISAVSLRRAPPHTLVIQVRTHKLVAIASLEKLYLVNDRSELINGRHNTEGLPVITGLKLAQSSYTQEMVKIAVQAILAYNVMSKGEERIKRIHIHPQLGLISYGMNDEKVTLGFKDFKKKWRYLAELELLAKNSGRKLADAYLAEFAEANYAPVRFERGGTPNR